MFNWRDFFGFVAVMFAVLVPTAIIATGFYMMCEMGNAWGYALAVVGALLGGGIAVGFGL